MKTASIRRASIDAIVAQAEREFPFECCGFIIGDNENEVEEVHPIANIQNRIHAKDPVAFPRDARTAFLMEPKEHLAVMNEVDRRKLAIRVVYHSHPDHDAYFSPTDRAQACSFDPTEPDYPETVYIVLSIRAGKFARAAAFAWDSEKKNSPRRHLLSVDLFLPNGCVPNACEFRLDPRIKGLDAALSKKMFHVKRF